MDSAFSLGLALHVLLLGFLSPSASIKAGDPKPLQVVPGQDVLLPCEAPESTDLEDLILEWTRSSPKDKYVFMFRDGGPLKDFQDPHFEGRVEISEDMMRKGNFSIKLYSVGKLDSGVYGCHVLKLKQSHARKRSILGTQPIRTVNLTVVPPVAKTIQAFPGQDVLLPADKVDFSVTSAMWKRQDDPERFVFLMGMGHPHHQNPQYFERTELCSYCQTKDQISDLSMILRRVQPSDSGTYHLHIIQSKQSRVKRDLLQPEPYSVVILKVASSGAFRFEAGVGFVAVVFISLFLQILG